MPTTPGRYYEIIHTAAFEATAEGLLTAEQIRDLELMLATRPDAGAVIPGTDGVRKVRVALSGRARAAARE